MWDTLLLFPLSSFVPGMRAVSIPRDGNFPSRPHAGPLGVKDALRSCVCAKNARQQRRNLLIFLAVAFHPSDFQAYGREGGGPREDHDSPPTSVYGLFHYIIQKSTRTCIDGMKVALHEAAPESRWTSYPRRTANSVTRPAAAARDAPVPVTTTPLPRVPLRKG